MLMTRCVVSISTSVALLALPLTADPGEFDLLSDSLEAIAEKGLGSGTQNQIRRRTLAALAATFDRGEKPLMPLLRTDGSDTSGEQFARTIRALAETSGRSNRYWIERAVTSYLRSIDPQSDFLSPAAFREYKESMSRDFAGVGMELERGDGGSFICLPFPGMAAERAGVKWGAELLAVDGRGTSGMPLPSVATQIRGEPGSQVRLTLKRKGFLRANENVIVTRAPIRAPAVLLKQGVAGSVIQILTFNGETARKIGGILKVHEEGRTLTLDLRGCPGGSLQAAIATADLFLEPEMTVVSVERNGGVSRYRTESNPSDRASPVVILQDGRTASAAEVFISALTENGRAVSTGVRSYGKGTVQEIIELRGGYGMILTTGRLLGPKGAGWNGRGLESSR